MSVGAYSVIGDHVVLGAGCRVDEHVVIQGPTRIGTGSPIGDIASLRDKVAVTAAHGGQIVEWLVEDGDLVSPGQPLIRLHPEGAA